MSHFGSTTKGFLDATPLAKDIKDCSAFWYKLKKEGVIESVNLKTRKPLRDIAEIEAMVARGANRVIATSEKVKQELISQKVLADNIEIIHNSIEDYWFESNLTFDSQPTHLIFLGRLGGDPFNLKLKGFDRLVHLFTAFKEVPKVTVCMTQNKKLVSWMMSNLYHNSLFVNLKKDRIASLLNKYAGSIALITSRYEGFSLSLIEAMSQGLVPIVFNVGVAPEIIINGENGFIVDNLKEAQEKVSVLLSNPVLRQKMSKEAYRTSQCFTADKLADRLEAFYRQFVGVRREEKHKDGYQGLKLKKG